MFRRGEGFRLEEVRYANKYIYIYIYIYLCDFAKRCLLSFRLNTGIARVQASVAGKKTGGLPSC